MCSFSHSWDDEHFGSYTESMSTRSYFGTGEMCANFVGRLYSEICACVRTNCFIVGTGSVGGETEAPVLWSDTEIKGGKENEIMICTIEGKWRKHTIKSHMDRRIIINGWWIGQSYERHFSIVQYVHWSAARCHDIDRKWRQMEEQERSCLIQIGGKTFIAVFGAPLEKNQLTDWFVCTGWCVKIMPSVPLVSPREKHIRWLVSLLRLGLSGRRW